MTTLTYNIWQIHKSEDFCPKQKCVPHVEISKKIVINATCINEILSKKLHFWIVNDSWISHTLYVTYSTRYVLCTYRKVASSRLFRLIAHLRIFRLFMKGKFDAYVLWSLAKIVQNWIVDQSSARNVTVTRAVE